MLRVAMCWKLGQGLHIYSTAAKYDLNLFYDLIAIESHLCMLMYECSELEAKHCLKDI